MLLLLYLFFFFLFLFFARARVRAWVLVVTLGGVPPPPQRPGYCILTTVAVLAHMLAPSRAGSSLEQNLHTI
jgi:hypothetical protein